MERYSVSKAKGVHINTKPFKHIAQFVTPVLPKGKAIKRLHTTKPNTPMLIMAYIIPNVPNTLLLDAAEMVVLITPKPGMISI